MGEITNVISAFSEEHVVRLTGLTRGQLRSWDRDGFFAPKFGYADRQAAYSRVYSFQDVVGLRTLAVLMQKHHVSLQQLKKVAKELMGRGYEHWAEVKLYVVKKQVHFQPPGTSDVQGVWDGQLAMVEVIDVIHDVEDRVRELKKRPPSQFGKIERHKHVVRNAPVIAGTRITTAAVRRFHEAGYSVEQIQRQYPSLTAEDIRAALSHEEGLARSA